MHPTGFRAGPGTGPSAPGGITALYRQLAAGPTRNTRIASDVTIASEHGRNCLVLTRLTGHATHLAGMLTAAGLDRVLVTGRLGARTRKQAIADLTDPDRGGLSLTGWLGPTVTA